MRQQQSVSPALKHPVGSEAWGIGDTAGEVLNRFSIGLALLSKRDILDDDSAALRSFLYKALEEGMHCLPDGRFYVSSMHGPLEVDTTLQAIGRIL